MFNLDIDHISTGLTGRNQISRYLICASLGIKKRFINGFMKHSEK